MLDLSLFILSSATGLVLVIGCLILLWKGRIVLDTEGKSLSKIELPFGIKLSTQFPVLMIFVLGVVLLLYPVYQARNICPDLSMHRKIFPEMVKVKGVVVSKEPVDVFAVVDEQSNTHADVILNVPFRKDTRYRILYAVGDKVLQTYSFDLPDTNTFNLNPIEVQTTAELAPEPSPTGTPRTEPQQIAAEYKKEGQN